MSKNKIQFSGVVFFSGMEILPGDLVLSISEIRKWAYEQGFISDPEFQLMFNDRISSLSDFFVPEDGLQLALAIHTGVDDPFYFEYPYLPVKSLIDRDIEVEIYYWRMIPTRWDTNREVIYYGEVKFGFQMPGCNEEICSISTAKHVVEKFQSLILNQLKYGEIRSFNDGSKEAVVDGELLARFYKEGRFYNVTFEWKQH